jgi:hypothetical protein
MMPQWECTNRRAAVYQCLDVTVPSVGQGGKNEQEISAASLYWKVKTAQIRQIRQTNNSYHGHEHLDHHFR